ncbi:hypothetical protein GCM10022221_62680 [Actinocorallia aurea]
MSVTGMWIIGAIPEPDATDLSIRLSAAQEHEPSSASFADLAAWWNRGGDGEEFFGAVPGRPWERDTEAASRLMTLVDLADPGSEESASVWDDCLKLMSSSEDGAVFVASARKASPVAALCYALEAARMALVPGTFGNFLLRGGDVNDGLRRIESAFDLSDGRRAEAVHRMRVWMEEVGDAPEFDGEGLLSGPLRVMRYAAANGQGVAALSRWY